MSDRVVYDIVWCAPSHEEQALGIVRRLSYAEITMRGLVGMRGLRVYPAAPMPQDDRGVYAGDVGECIMTNWLGSEAITSAPTAITRPNYTARQTIAAATLCERIDILERSSNGRPLLVGGILRSDVFTRADVQDAAYRQARQERANVDKMRVHDADRSEVFVAKVAQFANQYGARPIACIATWLSDSAWTRIFAIVLAIIATIIMWITELPAVAYISLRAKVRARKRWRKLSDPFNPFSEARAAVANSALPQIRIHRRI